MTRRRARSCVAIVGALVGLFTSSPVHASEPKSEPKTSGDRLQGEATAIDYGAPARCPDRGAFLAELRARTKAFVEAPTAPRTFVVRIEPRGGEAVQASLALARAGRSGRPRTLEARSCVEAVRALSFLVALVLDPDAKPPAASAEAVAASTTPGSSAPVSNTADHPEEHAPTTTAAALDEAGKEPTSVARASPDGQSVRAAEGAREPRRLDLRWVAALSADGAGLAVDGLVVGGGLAIGARFGDRLELRASIHRTLGSSVAIASTTSSFTWTFGRLAACVDLLAVDRVVFGPCAAVDVGSLSAEGGGVRRASSPSRLWGAAGVDAFARARLLGPTFVTLAAGPFVPFDRTAFAYEPAPGSTAPEFTVYRPPSVGLRAGVGFGFAWR